ncbi:MAG TPA: RraA family protein [Rhodothermales bacterium]|nr:RraA family protein [Rhodothermales bacterium]
MSQETFDKYAAEMRAYEYPLSLPPKPTDPRTLDVDDLERVARYRGLYGGCVSDALLRNGIADTVLSHALRPLRAHSILAGRALPVKWHSLAPETHMTADEKKARQEEWDREGSPQKQLHLSAFPGCVMVFDTGHDTQAATFGEMSCHLAQSRGCVGVVNEGMTRDVRKILEMENFPYFSLGTTPNAYGGWRVMDVNVPIYLRGHIRHYVIVNPGDFIFGDDDGLQVIPKDLVDEVLLTAEEILATEVWQRRLIDTGEIDIHEVYQRFGDL